MLAIPVKTQNESLLSANISRSHSNTGKRRCDPKFLLHPLDSSASQHFYCGSPFHDQSCTMQAGALPDWLFYGFCGSVFLAITTHLIVKLAEWSRPTKTKVTSTSTSTISSTGLEDQACEICVMMEYQDFDCRVEPKDWDHMLKCPLPSPKT